MSNEVEMPQFLLWVPLLTQSVLPLSLRSCCCCSPLL